MLMQLVKQLQYHHALWSIVKCSVKWQVPSRFMSYTPRCLQSALAGLSLCAPYLGALALPSLFCLSDDCQFIL